MEQLLASLREEKIKISLKGDDLKIRFDGAQIPEHLLEALRQNKEELVSYLKEHRSTKNMTIPKVAEQLDGYPLSSAQSSMWVICQMEEASVAYNMSFSLAMTIENVPFFRRAVDDVIDRHEALRTLFRANDEGLPRQWILDRKELDMEVRVVDFRDEEDRKAKARAFSNQDAIRPFDLEKGPLLRAYLLQLGENEFLFYYCLHHIICDGWSMDVLAADVMGRYQNYLDGTQQEWPPLAIQYKDYACWQQDRLLNGELNRQKDYWIDNLRGELPMLDLPTTRNRPAIKTFVGESMAMQLPSKVVARLNALVKDKGGSLFMAFLTGLQTSLSFYTGETDIAVGTPVSGRVHRDLEPQIGFYLNVLVMRSEISWDRSFKELYNELKTRMIQNLEHQDYPFDQLVNDLEIPRDVSRSPMFDVLMDYHGKTDPVISQDTNERVDLGKVNVKYDLEFHLYEVGNDIQLVLNFNSDVYERSTIEGFVDYYLRLMERMDFGQPLQTYQGLSEVDIAFLDSHSVGEDQPLEWTNLLKGFDLQVQRNPERTAINYQKESWSYAKLEQYSNQLANGLIHDYGVTPGQVVAIHFDTNPWTVVTILAILKAGAAYLYVDTSLPEERKKYLLEDSGALLVITETSHLFDLNDYEGTLCSIDVEFNPQWATYAVNKATPDGAAYLIYTSGSTGKPKGVTVTHYSLSNYLQWAAKHYSEEGKLSLHFGLFTTLGFDLTITSLYVPLITGNSLTIIDSEDVVDQLKHHFNGTMTAIKLTPAHIGLIPNLGLSETEVEVAVVGGDVLQPYHVDLLRSLNPSMRIYNEYGPTEATVGCIVQRVKPQQDTIRIGKPIQNMSAIILNSQLQQVPPGVAGELYLAGAGLAQGYHGQPILTNERFLEWNGQRVYKTGDRCKWLEDGTMLFEGRTDDQVKIQGYRIEPGEIANRIIEKPSVQDAVVLSRPDSRGGQELVGYVVSNSEENTAALRAFLQDRLPAYMIPSHFVSVESIPLNNNGKVDKRTLEAISGSQLEAGIVYVAPEDNMEQRICEIWSGVLADREIGRNHDFFLLGGNSLLAIRLINAYQKEFHVKVTLTEIFTKSTVLDHKELLTSKIEQKQEEIETLEF
ncbi:MAG: amino acid adenylation domain-containing protein [Bacteroidota bacterium]